MKAPIPKRLSLFRKIANLNPPTVAVIGLPPIDSKQLSTEAMQSVSRPQYTTYSSSRTSPSTTVEGRKNPHDPLRT